MNNYVTDMLMLFAVGCSVITFFMSLLHILLLFGVPIGEYVLGGKNRIIPKEKRYINVIFACVFLALGLFYLSQAKIINVYFPMSISMIIMIIYSLFLMYAIIGNVFLTQSKKEKILMIPSSVIGFICSLLTLILSMG